MEYLDKVLGVKVTYDDVEFKHLPNFIATRYRLRMVSMNEQKMIFLYPKTELEQIEVLKKHIARIQNNENLPIFRKNWWEQSCWKVDIRRWQSIPC